MDRVAHFAVAVAKQAVADAKFDVSQEDPTRCGVCVGTGIGGINTFLDQSLKFAAKGPSRISPFFIPMEIPNMPAAHIGIQLGFKGPNTCIVTACATGTNCIGDALRTIQYGDADVMIAGGVEASINEMAIAGFENEKPWPSTTKIPRARRAPSTNAAAALSWARAAASCSWKNWSTPKTRRPYLRGTERLRHEHRRLPYHGSRSVR